MVHLWRRDRDWRRNRDTWTGHARTAHDARHLAVLHDRRRVHRNVHRGRSVSRQPCDFGLGDSDRGQAGEFIFERAFQVRVEGAGVCGLREILHLC